MIDLTNDDISRLLASYQQALSAVLEQPNNQEEDIVLLNHMIANVQSIQCAWEYQVPSNTFSWTIMTYMAGSPQVLNSNRTHALQYDPDKNINRNIQLLYYNLLLNNRAATEDLKRHINKNYNIEMISGLLTIISIILSELIAPWSAWGVSFSMPLYATLAVPLIVIFFLTLAIERVSRLHSSTLGMLRLRHEIVDRVEYAIDEHGVSNVRKTATFFQPRDSNHLLQKVEESYIQLNNVPMLS